MKQILISLKPNWWNMIASGEKKYEFRGKNFRKVVEHIREMQKTDIEMHPYKRDTGKFIAPKDVWFYVYESNGKKHKQKREVCFGKVNSVDVYEGRGKVVGKFRVGMVYDDVKPYDFMREEFKRIGFDETKHKYAIEIDKVEVFDKPKELNDFVNYNLSMKAIADVPVTRPPQSFMYIWEVDNE